jgi:hypothetical protein
MENLGDLCPRTSSREAEADEEVQRLGIKIVRTTIGDAVDTLPVPGEISSTVSGRCSLFRIQDAQEKPGFKMEKEERGH